MRAGGLGRRATRDASICHCPTALLTTGSVPHNSHAHTCRDLAEQTHENINLFRKHLAEPPVRTALLIGGTNPAAAQRALAEGVDIVTGTPGALICVLCLLRCAAPCAVFCAVLCASWPSSGLRLD